MVLENMYKVALYKKSIFTQNTMVKKKNFD